MKLPKGYRHPKAGETSHVGDLVWLDYAGWKEVKVTLGQKYEVDEVTSFATPIKSLTLAQASDRLNVALRNFKLAVARVWGF